MALIQPLTDPLLTLWNGLVGSVPGILAAIVTLIVGYLIAWVLSRVVSWILHKVDADKWLLQKTSLKKTVGDFKLSKFLALITKWYVFVLFLPPAAGMVKMTSLSIFLLDVAKWIPNIIVGVIIALIGIVAADYVSTRIYEMKAKAAGLVGIVAKVIILVFTALIVLSQIGVQVHVAESSFLIVLGGIMLGIALMIGIGFGLAFKVEAGNIIKQVKKKL